MVTLLSVSLFEYTYGFLDFDQEPGTACIK